MNLNSEDLCQVTEDVCQSMLGLRLVKTDSESSDETFLVASVSITGEWNATLEVAVCPQAADAITASMFDTEPGNATEEEVIDAISEVANMIGGNIKGLLGGECNLSLPCAGGVVTQPTGDFQSLSYDLASGVLQVYFRQMETANVSSC